MIFMAKRPEFKPDKPRVGLLSKLYLTQKQRKSILKWALYALVLLVLSLVQDVLLCKLNIFGATTELVPVGIFLICLHISAVQVIGNAKAQTIPLYRTGQFAETTSVLQTENCVENYTCFRKL